MYETHDDEMELGYTLVDRRDGDTQKNHYDRVWDSGCWHDAILVESGATFLVSCSECEETD